MKPEGKVSVFGGYIGNHVSSCVATAEWRAGCLQFVNDIGLMDDSYTAT